MTDTQTEQVETTLADDLAAAFAAVETPEVENEETESVEEVTEEPDEEAKAEEEVDETASEVEKEFPLIPKDWSEDEKNAFQALIDSEDPDKALAAEILVERYNLLKKGFYKTTRDNADAKKLADSITQVFAPYKEALARTGITEPQYIHELIQWDSVVTKDPVDGIKKLMQKFNVSPEQLGIDSWNDDFTNDSNYDINEVTALKKELNELKSQFANAPVVTQIRQFEEATDSEGKLLHPHFNQVKPIMGSLIQSNPNLTLDAAYKKAVKTLDLEESDSPETTVDVDKLREKVAKARKAQRSVKSTNGKLDPAQMSLAEELTARINGFK